ncbi:MAG: CopG family transcriptional regulator [Acidobacteria bacterium]|nr:CopG family transcriptional regulator [Acidobacteriota bacterium]
MKDEYDFSNAKRGAVIKTPPGKSRVTIRLDNEVLEWFRAKVHESGGGNYQTLINAALRDHVAASAPELEAMMRKVVREELARGRDTAEDH